MERMYIAIPLIVLILIGMYVLLKFANKATASASASKKRQRRALFKAKEPHDEKAEARQAAQEVIGVADIVGPDVIMRDGSIINIFTVECVNVSLMVPLEQIEEAARTARVLSTLQDGFTIIKFHRPADNTAQIRRLEETLKNVEKELQFYSSKNTMTPVQKHNRIYALTRHQILSERIQAELENERRCGRRHTTETILCVKTPAAPSSQKTAQERARGLLSSFSTNGYNAKRLTDLELIDVYRAYFDEPAEPQTNLDPHAQVPCLKDSLRAAIEPGVREAKESAPAPSGEEWELQVLPQQPELTEDDELERLLASLGKSRGRREHVA